MNPAKCVALDYIPFLVAAQQSFTCQEAARCQPEGRPRPTTPLPACYSGSCPTRRALWPETRDLVRLDAGVLVLDDTTLDKPYTKKMDLVTRHWSGKHGQGVWGINRLTLLWSDGTALIPCDFRLYDKPWSGLTKNDYFRQLLAVAQERGFAPRHALFDRWYSSLKNRKGVRVFRTVATDGAGEHWATNDLELPPEQRAELARQAWWIENYHRGLKQCCGVEKSPARSDRAQWNHIRMALQAFLRLEVHRLRTGISWYQAKSDIIRAALRRCLANPAYLL